MIMPGGAMSWRRKPYKKPEIRKARNHGVACWHCRIPEERCWKTRRSIGEALDPACSARLNKVAALDKK